MRYIYYSDDQKTIPFTKGCASGWLQTIKNTNYKLIFIGTIHRD